MIEGNFMIFFCTTKKEAEQIKSKYLKDNIPAFICDVKRRLFIDGKIVKYIVNIEDETELLKK
jgi:hypothetical protein